jgi:hypothetical protein
MEAVNRQKGAGEWENRRTENGRMGKQESERIEEWENGRMGERENGGVDER